MDKTTFQEKMRLFYSGRHIDNDADDLKYQKLAEKFQVIQAEMFTQQQELNEIVTDMDSIMDVASKADEKRKRKDGRHETLSKDSLKPSAKGIKTRT